jgi:hypothetical protein
MMSTKAKVVKETPNMCRLDRTRRKKDEGRDYKWCGSTRTNETRQWYKRQG